MILENSNFFLLGKSHDGLNSVLCCSHIVIEAVCAHILHMVRLAPRNVLMEAFAMSEALETLIRNGHRVLGTA